jgi:hypothetical protein
MSDLKDVVAIANEMIGHLGKNAEPIVAERAIVNYREGDHEAASLWRRVAAAIRAIEIGTEVDSLN